MIQFNLFLSLSNRCVFLWADWAIDAHTSRFDGKSYPLNNFSIKKEDNIGRYIMDII